MSRRGRALAGSRVLLPLGLLLLLVLSSLLPQLFSGGSISPPGYRVRNAEGGPPPAGTRVAAVSGEEGPVMLNGVSGRFRPAPDHGRPVEYEAVYGPLRARAAAPAGAKRFVVRLPASFVVAGRVVNERTGEGVPGASVVCGVASVRTDDRGRFRLGPVPAADGKVPSVTVQAEGFGRLDVGPDPDDPWDDLFLRLIPE